MKFNLAKGTIQKASGKIGQKRNLVSHLGYNFCNLGGNTKNLQ